MLPVMPATEQDVPALADLFAEMDRFYGAPDVVTSAKRRADLNTALFAEPPIANVLLARSGRDLVAFASYSFLWPAVGLTPSLFLKELYVAEQHRGIGAGRALMHRLLQIAAETGCSRVEWMTERANSQAQGFYTRLGYAPNTEKVFYRVDCSLG